MRRILRCIALCMELVLLTAILPFSAYGTASPVQLTPYGPAEIQIEGGKRCAVEFLAPYADFFTFESTNRGNLDPCAYTYTTGNEIWDDDAATDGRNYRFTRYLSKGDSFIYYSGVYTDSLTANGSYMVQVTGSTPLPPRVPGDADCNGTVRADDAALILRYLVGLAQISELGLRNANVTGDALVSAGDAALILRYLVGLAVLE